MPQSNNWETHLQRNKSNRQLHHSPKKKRDVRLNPGDALRSLVGRVLGSMRLLTDNLADTMGSRSEVLYAFYDLSVSPATFDIIVFLILAEISRVRQNCDCMHIVIVPGHEQGFQRGSLKNYRATGHKNANYEYMSWRRDNILLPSCSLILLIYWNTWR